MNLTKHYDFFNPLTLEQNIHIIGCGAIGSNLAAQLVRLGCSNIHLYDFDIVEEHNITNQLYTPAQIHAEKTTALMHILTDINVDCAITIHNEGWQTGDRLDGYVFLCVDDIETRHAIVKENYYNPQIIAFFDFRMRLTDAQHYAAKREDHKQMEMLLASMDFTHKEAKDATEISACGTTMSVTPTVWTIVALGVSNFINLIRRNELKFIILLDAFKYTIDAY